ncbi:MAG: hypothetical protein AAGD13_04790 [Pseudomonadota bacterium]
MSKTNKLKSLSRVMSAKKRAETAKLKSIALQIQSLRSQASDARATSRSLPAPTSSGDMQAIASHQHSLEQRARMLEAEAATQQDAFAEQKSELSRTFGRAHALQHVVEELEDLDRAERERRAEEPPMRTRVIPRDGQAPRRFEAYRSR